ncbi:MAG TPA: cytochrome c oxidase assembly protein [Acidimicrobiales bacterium]|nr:cytochrome c oxidase assembly protein [Acidimicrobiales bacterium]
MAAGQRIGARDLLTHVAGGPFVLVVGILTVSAVIGYLAAVRRVGAPAGRWPLGRTAAFVAGAFGAWVSVGSGVAVYSMTSLTLHIVRHVILMMTVPALISLGRPVTLLRASGIPGAARLLDTASRSRVLGAATHPVPVWFIYLASMYLMLADRPFFAYMMAHPMVQDSGTVSMVVIGLLYWGMLVASGETRRGPSYPARVISILANMPFEVLAGIWLRYQMRPMDPMYTLGDTRAAGEAFIVGATLISTVWLVAVVVQWLAAAWREENAGPKATGDSPGWTVPWWVESVSEA